MAINLNKHRESILAAWNDVLDDKSATNWALFGYDGQSNDLKFVSKGDGGLEEIADEFNSSKVMYAFLRIYFEDSSVYKNVLINWQGESAPTIRKGTCANHIASVSKLLPAHLTIHARTEDDLDEKSILQDLVKASSNVNIKTSKSEITPSGPIGTAYKKVNPGAEINSRERDAFWLKEEQEEKKRKENEQRNKEEEKRKIEEDIKKRKLAEKEADAATAYENNHKTSMPEKPIRSSIMAQRIKNFTQNASSDSPIAPTSKPSSKHIAQTRQAFEGHKNGGVEQTNKHVIEQSQNGKQAREETKQDIKENGDECRDQLPVDVVEEPKKSPLRNIDKIALSLEKPSQIQHEPIFDPADLSPESTSQPIQHYDAVDCEAEGAYSSSSNDEEERFSTIKRSPKVLEKQDTVIHVQQIPSNGNTTLDDVSPDEDEGEDAIYEDLDEDPGLTARALYDYQAADETEISFEPGEIITHIEQIDPGWWQGLSPANTFGLFPANYVQLL